MRQITEMARDIWWAFAAAGAAAFVAALAILTSIVTPQAAIGAWTALTGPIVLAGAARAPGRLANAVPFLAAGVVGLLLGGALLVLPSKDPRTGVLALGIWGMVAAAGYLAAARIARALGISDGGLYATSWVAFAAGMAIAGYTFIGLAATSNTAAAALAAIGVVTLLASARLRALPTEAPLATSKRELRRQERAGRRR